MYLVYGGENIRNEILRELQSKNIIFQHLAHRETAHQNVAREVGVALHEGIKCLIVRGKKTQQNYLVCVRGHQRVDMRAISALVHENCEFERAEVIQTRYGLEIGGIPPYGSFLGVDVYFDSGIQESEEVIFSCGLGNESIRMKLEDLIPFVHPQFASFAKV